MDKYSVYQEDPTLLKECGEDSTTEETSFGTDLSDSSDGTTRRLLAYFFNWYKRRHTVAVYLTVFRVLKSRVKAKKSF